MQIYKKLLQRGGYSKSVAEDPDNNPPAIVPICFIDSNDEIGPNEIC
ncbi:hypothetical protein JMUB7504_27220 [Staphylococcus aureus]